MGALRIIETNEGIQNAQIVEHFNLHARNMRDKGYNGVEGMIASGVWGGDILEVGSGPGYVGLELAKKVKFKSLTGCEISNAMIRIAQQNAENYGIEAKFIVANAMDMPFADCSFDSVVSNGSLHEWENPIRVFNEVYRVLRPHGQYCITDLRRDVSSLKKTVVYLSTKPKEMRPGLISSLNAAYTVSEIIELLRHSNLQNAKVHNDFFGLIISGVKK